MSARFCLGKIVATPTALAAVSEMEILLALTRHQAGDWGELDDEDRAANEVGVEKGYRLLSAYRSGQGAKFWIITEWDRSVTTVLLPEDY